MNMTKRLVIFLSLIICISNANSAAISKDVPREKILEDEKINLSLSSFYWVSSVVTTASDTSEAVSSSISHFGVMPHITYFINDKHGVVGSYFTSSTLSSTTVSSGYEIGYRWYAIGEGSTTRLQSTALSMLRRPRTSWFLEGAYKSRSFDAETTTVKFLGVAFKVGVDFHLSERLFFTGNFGYDYLYSGESRTLTSLNGSFGIGTTY